MGPSFLVRFTNDRVCIYTCISSREKIGKNEFNVLYCKQENKPVQKCLDTLTEHKGIGR